MRRVARDGRFQTAQSPGCRTTEGKASRNRNASATFVHVVPMAAILIALVAVLGVSSATAASPVATGRLDYRLSWNGIPAADATVDVWRDPASPELLYRVEATARTNWVVDVVWSLRAYAGSRFATIPPTPLWFRYDREINDERSVTDIAFESSPPYAIGTRRRRDRTNVVDVEEPGILDPIAAIFHALSQPIEVGDTLAYELFTGESRYRVELRISGQEPVDVAGGTFPAWRVDPKVWKVGKGPEPRLRGATVWVSQEPVRALLRVRSEVFIGAVNCDLLRLPESRSSSLVEGMSPSPEAHQVKTTVAYGPP